MTREEIKKAMRDTKREIVIKNLHKLLPLVEGYPEYEDCISYAIEELEQEPRKGRWIEGIDEYYDGEDEYIEEYWECNQCHYTVKYVHDFCPACGADMRGEK